MAANELIDYIEFGNIKNSVNLPDAEMNAVGTKICVIHKNVPEVIANLTSVISGSGANIENMLNKSKKDFAYTMIDATGKDIDDAIVAQLSDIANVIKVRVIK